MYSIAIVYQINSVLDIWMDQMDGCKKSEWQCNEYICQVKGRVKFHCFHLHTKGLNKIPHTSFIYFLLNCSKLTENQEIVKADKNEVSSC